MNDNPNLQGAQRWTTRLGDVGEEEVGKRRRHFFDDSMQGRG